MDNDQKENNQIKAGGIKVLDLDVIFANDPYGLFVYKKIEKLVAGIYLLTGYLSDKEPFKWNLREVANTLLFKAISLSDRVWGEDNINNGLVISICEISSILKVASVSNMISEINHQIIQSEFDKLANFLSSSANNVSSAKIAFSQDLFNGDYNFNLGSLPSMYQKTTENATGAGFPYSYKGQKDIKDKQNNDVLNNMSATKHNSSDKILKDKTNRQEIIISMLKSGMKLTIKDFAKNIKDCSEKTIQRELLALVLKGVLKKEGERRWSKYYMA